MSAGGGIVFDGYRPGALGRICELQAVFFAEATGFGAGFETKVAADMAEFIRRFDPERDLFLTVSEDGVIGGGITIVGPAGDGWARLRWFILAPGLQGRGIGRELMERAMAFIAEKGYERVFLTTVDGLDAARCLYGQAGFVLTASETGATWGVEMTEQRFERVRV